MSDINSTEKTIKDYFLKYFAFGNYTLLFFMLITLFILMSFKTDHDTNIVYTIIISLLLLACVHSIILNRKYFWFSIILVCVSMTVNWLNFIFPYNHILHYAVYTKPVFMFFTTFIIIEHVLNAKKVTLDILMGSVCAFLLLGITWALIYSTINVLHHGAFVYSNTDLPVKMDDLFYYSFITITTVGYGDILPNIPIAKTFSALEAIIGWFYMAILVAHLVSLHIMHSLDDENSSDDN